MKIESIKSNSNKQNFGQFYIKKHGFIYQEAPSCPMNIIEDIAKNNIERLKNLHPKFDFLVLSNSGTDREYKAFYGGTNIPIKTVDNKTFGLSVFYDKYRTLEGEFNDFINPIEEAIKKGIVKPIAMAEEVLNASKYSKKEFIKII